MKETVTFKTATLGWVKYSIPLKKYFQVSLSLSEIDYNHLPVATRLELDNGFKDALSSVSVADDIAALGGDIEE